MKTHLTPYHFHLETLQDAVYTLAAAFDPQQDALDPHNAAFDPLAGEVSSVTAAFDTLEDAFALQPTRPSEV